MKNKCDKYFKIITKEGKTLFHGVNGSRKLQFNKWLKAETKEVTDGGFDRDTHYFSGWHVIKGIDCATKYLARFKDTSSKMIVPCEVRNIRKKQHSPNEVYLCEYIKLNCN